MRREVLETGLRRARDVRVALATLLVLSMLANLALGVGLAGRESVTVLVPAVTGPAWEVGAGRAGQRYLEDMARTAAVTLLSLTPENAEHVREAAARLSHPSARGAISAWVASEARRMAGRDLAAAFYPKRIEADAEGRSPSTSRASSRPGSGARSPRAKTSTTASRSASMPDGWAWCASRRWSDEHVPEHSIVAVGRACRPPRGRARGGVRGGRRPTHAGRGDPDPGGD